MPGYIATSVDYVSVAQQVRSDNGLVELLNALADEHADISNSLTGSDEELTDAAKTMLKMILAEVGVKCDG